MLGGGIENHWRLQGGDGYLIIRFFFFVHVCWLRSATNLRLI